MKTAYDFQARMAAAKDAAANEPHLDKRGGSTVRVFTSTSDMLSDQAPSQFDSFDLWLLQVADRVSEIVEQSRFAIYAERDRWADMIPF